MGGTRTSGPASPAGLTGRRTCSPRRTPGSPAHSPAGLWAPPVWSGARCRAAVLRPASSWGWPCPGSPAAPSPQPGRGCRDGRGLRDLGFAFDGAADSSGWDAGERLDTAPVPRVPGSCCEMRRCCGGLSVSGGDGRHSGLNRGREACGLLVKCRNFEGFGGSRCSPAVCLSARGVGPGPPSGRRPRTPGCRGLTTRVRCRLSSDPHRTVRCACRVQHPAGAGPYHLGAHARRVSLTG